MLKRERQEYILHHINLHNRIMSSDLCQEMEVSEDTIRHDLQELADEGKIVKVHGGALSNSFNLSGYSNVPVYSQDKKRMIARKAADFIKDGMFVLTTGGTTIIELARALPHDLNATFFTGSLPAAMEYIRHPRIEVIFIGDRISKNSQITVGGDAISRIRQIRADLCFLGINALDVEHGITDNDWEVVQVKKAMVESSEKVIAMTIAEKINTVQKIGVLPIHELDVLVTELSPDDPILEPYTKQGLEVR